MNDEAKPVIFVDKVRVRTAWFPTGGRDFYWPRAFVRTSTMVDGDFAWKRLTLIDSGSLPCVYGFDTAEQAQAVCDRYADFCDMQGCCMRWDYSTGQAVEKDCTKCGCSCHKPPSYSTGDWATRRAEMGYCE